MLLAMVAMFDMEFEQLDVKIAFLHSELEEQFFMHLLEGLLGNGTSGLILLWLIIVTHKVIMTVVCITKNLSDGSFIYLLLYVDDMLITMKNKSESNKLKSQLRGEFEMKDLGAAKKILGMEIHRDKKADKLFLSHKNYIENILERFGMKDSKPVTTPLAAHFKLSSTLSSKSKDDEEKMSRVSYVNAVGTTPIAAHLHSS
ncbi:hypothetical protein EZV62_000463 [Acer yangbiense]|uniref:Reverse transcriptase Ty1/copia-type domain-containing protein n=1 Tax=Acer yangbiense TaxID=1000413 RepID=A0A5C7ISS2_9ROSI|nr:hypothetical protein EZV62_000463 [Acer yangbiense]